MHQIDGSHLVPKKITKHRFRRSIIEAWFGCCAYCGDRPERITLDHVLPKVEGGMTVRSNLIPACCRCNGSKAHSDWLSWYGQQPYHDPAREQRIRAWVDGEP
ncbi:MAG: HNH endonuclease signature motif containing protein [Synechococcus sp. ELA057]|jgi:5-methylcytosine-specific restriction endonuclease McrA